MAKPCEVQPLAAPAPLPPTSLADPVAAAAAQLVVDAIEQLSMQQLQGAAETPATCADDGRGAQTLEAAPDAQSSDPAPADADGHASAASLPDGPLCHVVQEGTLLHDLGTSCIAEGPAAAEVVARLEQEQAPDLSASTRPACLDERPATASSRGALELAECEHAPAAYTSTAVLQPETVTAAAAAVHGWDQDAEAGQDEDGPAAAPAAGIHSHAAAQPGMDAEQEAAWNAALTPAEHSQLAGSAAAMEQADAEHQEAPLTGNTSREPSQLEEALRHEYQEPAAELRAAAIVPAGKLATTDAPLEAAAEETVTPPAKLATRPAVEPAEVEAAADPAPAAEPELEKESSAATEEAEEAAQLEDELVTATDEAQPDVAIEPGAATELEAAYGEAGQQLEAADGEARQEHELLADCSSPAPALSSDGQLGDSEDAAAADAYSQALNLELSAKLLAVLSEQQLQGQQQGRQAADSCDLQALCEGGEESLGLGACAQPEPGQPREQALLAPQPDELAPCGNLSQSPGAAAALLRWNPVGPRRGSPHTGRAAAPAVQSSPTALASPAATAGMGPSGPAQRRRMAPLPAHSPTAIARAAGVSPPPGKSASAGRALPSSGASSGAHRKLAGPAGRPRRLSKPSMHEILRAPGQGGPRSASHSNAGGAGSRHLPGCLPTAQLLTGRAPYQLSGGAMVSGPFPVMGGAHPNAMLHWGANPAAPVAPALPLAGPAGWFVPAAVPAAGQGGYLVQPGMMGPPPNSYEPYGQPEEVAGAAGASAEAAYGDCSSGVAAWGQGSTKVDGTCASADGCSAAEQQAEGQRVEHGHDPGFAATAFTGETGGQAAADGVLQPAEDAQRQEQYDVAASWQPFDGAKLPPLRQGHMSTPGLIPAVYSASGFSAAPSWRGHPARFPVGWAAPAIAASPEQHAVPGGCPGPVWAGQPGMVAPAQQWSTGGVMPYSPGSIEEQQQAAAMHLFFQQQQAAAGARMHSAQHAAPYGHNEQYAARQGYAGITGMHDDGPTFYRELPLPVPVAIDARGRPFKVFHGVAARSQRRPERYQGDGRPAWSR